MSKANDKLLETCSQVEELANKAIDWAWHNDELVGIEMKSLQRQLSRIKARASSLQRSVGRKPCVGVVGARGSGKTHLIAGLAGRGPAPLSATFEGLDDGVDFLRQIRSDSAQASGVVVRFTNEDQGTPAKFPVEIGLMTPTDLIKILGSAYLSAAASEHVVAPLPSDVEELAARVGHQLSPFATAGITADDVSAIQEHFEHCFAGSSVVRALAAGGYWDYLSAMLPRLPQEGRLEMLAPLWGGLPRYSLIYDLAVNALEKLGFEETAYCSLAAIAAVDPDSNAVHAIRDSIINIDPLFRIGHADDEAVVVRSQHGAWAAVGRGVLAALTKEVRICLKESDSQLLEQADVLEFPGLHSPGDLAGDWAEGERSDAVLLALFAKHKAARLFEAYSLAHEITSLVIAVQPGDDYLSGLSQQVSRWILSAHGKSALERERIDTGAFLVFTMLDKEIPLSDEEGAPGADWSAKIDRAMTSGVGWRMDWPRDWTPGRPFDHLFLFRSPHFRSSELCDYIGNGLELSIRSSRINHVSIAREQFLENELAARHFADLHTAWHEAMEPGDGGSTLLTQSLIPVCNELARRRQITSEFTELRYAMGNRLLRFSLCEDELAQQDMRRRSGQVVVRALQTTSDRKLLGKIMRTLHVSESELVAVFHNLETNPYRANASHVPAATLTDRINASMDRLRNDDGSADDGGAGGANSGGDEADHWGARYARAACEYWTAIIRSVSNSPCVAAQFGLSARAFACLADELLAAAVRHDLQGELAKRIDRTIKRQANVPQRMATAAIIAAESFSMFTNCLGFDERWADHHPRRKGRAQKPIFSPRQETGLASIAAVRARLGKAFFNDWSVAYMAMIEDNADYLRNRRAILDDAAPQAQDLDQLLQQLSPPEFWPAFRSAP